jgi:hypothetical protein
MPISGDSALEFETKKERKHYFREVRNICVEGRVERTRWSHISITFSEEDVKLHGFPHNDALVIEANIASWTLGKLLVDNGSSADIIFADAFNKMGLSKDLLQPPDTPLSMPLPGAPAVGVLDQQTYQGGTRGSRLCSEDCDWETENSKVCARTWDTRFIQVRVAKVANPTSCLGIKYGALRLVLVEIRSGARLDTQPSFI